ncbi:MAG: hypothetical protein ACYCQI_13805 [Gammaproteobacteria bacterium]
MFSSWWVPSFLRSEPQPPSPIHTESKASLEDIEISPRSIIKPAANAVLCEYKDPELNMVKALFDAEDQTLGSPDEPFECVTLNESASTEDERITIQTLEPDDLPIQSYDWIEAKEVRKQHATIQAKKNEMKLSQSLLNCANENNSPHSEPYLEEIQKASAIIEKTLHSYSELDDKWRVPAALKSRWLWKYTELPTKDYANPQSLQGEYVTFFGYRYNAKYPNYGAKGLILAGAVTFSGPHIYFAFTAPMTKGTLSLAYLASQSNTALTLGTLYGTAAAYVNIRLLNGTIPLASTALVELVINAPDQPLKTLALSIPALTGAGAQAFLAKEAFAWASPPLQGYMVLANFLGFLALRGFGLTNALTRFEKYQKETAHLPWKEKLETVFTVSNMLSIPPALIAAIVFGQKIDGVLSILSNNAWARQSLMIRAPVNIVFAIANPILYFGQIQQIPTTAKLTYKNTIANTTQGQNTAWIAPIGNLIADAFASLGSLNVGNSAVYDPNFFLSDSMPEVLKDIIRYGFMISAGFVNGRLLFATIYKPTPPARIEQSFHPENPDPLTGAIRSTHTYGMLIAEIKAVSPSHAQNPHLLFAFPDKMKSKHQTLSISQHAEVKPVY